MKILFISSILPFNNSAPWLYVSEIIDNIQKYFNNYNCEYFFWFLAKDNIAFKNLNNNLKDNYKINYIKKIRFSIFDYLFTLPYKKNYYNSDLANDLVKYIKNISPDYIIFTNLPSAVYIDDIRIKYSQNIKFILIAHNVEYIVEKEFSRFGKNIFQKLYHYITKNKIKSFEKKVLNNVDFIICISKNDAIYFNNIYKINKNKLFIIPFLYLFPKNLYNNNIYNKQKQIISFIGTMDWYPNIQGVIFFVKEVLPKLLKVFPNLEFYIVGRNPIKKLLKYKYKYPKNVIITGSVEDVCEYYHMSDIIVIPIFIGSGTKVKVLEAIASGVPTVMTEFVAKDYSFNNKSLMIANTVGEYIKKITTLLNDKNIAKLVSEEQLLNYEYYTKTKKLEIKETLQKIFKSGLNT